MATTISESQFSYVEYTALSTNLQLSGLSYSFQIDIVAVPSYHIGINNGKLYFTQGQKHICDLMTFGKSYDITGKHIRESIEVHKLEYGYGGTLF